MNILATKISALAIAGVSAVTVFSVSADTIGPNHASTTNSAVTIITDATAASTSAGDKTGKKDSEGHVLTSLWKEYKEAADADKPRQQESILQKIMDQSVSGGYAWDYCCAASEWYNVVCRRNWKQRDETEEAIITQAAAMDIPILAYTLPQYPYYIGEIIDAEWFASNVENRATMLRKSCNSAFYDRLNSGLHAFIADKITNDYEYLLWSAAWMGRDNEEVESAAKILLDAEIADSYPQRPYFDFRKLLEDNPYNAKDGADRLSALKEYSEKYSGKSVTLLAEQQMLIDRLQDLNQSGNATPEEYLVLRNDCERLIACRKEFKGDEAEIAACADEFERMIEYLDTKSIRMTAKDGVVSIFLQNVQRAELAIAGEGLTRKTVIDNPVCSYFCVDTVKYTMQDCPDGTYELKCTSGETNCVTKYRMYSISLAYRSIDTGFGIYIADYLTGKPIGKADIKVVQNDRTVTEAKDFTFNGFTSITRLLDGVSSSKRFTLSCSYTDADGFRRAAQDVSMRLNPDGSVSVEETLSAKIFLDRAAFNPGDTLQFKAVAYSTTADKSFRLTGSGYPITAKLADPDNNIVNTIDLTTNEFGSVSGNFAIPEDSKGGTYSLVMYDNDRKIATSRLTVDEFVLPAFELKFDRTDEVYFSGDTVSVKGKLTSYSGHGLSSAKLDYVIESYVDGEKKMESSSLTAASDGSFEIEFPADESERSINYYLTVKATELTGETGQWSKSLVVNPSSSISIGMSGTAEGEAVALAEESGSGKATVSSGGKKTRPEILLEDSFGLTFNVDITGLEVEPVTVVNYRIVPAVGTAEAVIAGTAASGETVEVSSEGLASGLYRIECEANYSAANGREIKLGTSQLLLKTADSDREVPRGMKYYYKKLENGRIAAQLATSEDERWYVAEIYGEGKKLLHSEVFCLRNEAKVIGIDYDDAYPDVVQMIIFSFRDSGRQSESFLYEREAMPDNVLPLEFSTFTGNALPGGKCRFVLQTAPDVEAVVSVFDKSTETIRRNVWSSLRKYSSSSPRVYISAYSGFRKSTAAVGRIREFVPGAFGDDDDLVAVPMYRMSLMTKTAAVAGVANDVIADVVEDTEVSDEMADYAEAVASGAEEDIYVRDRFDNIIAFLPFLRSDSSGRIEFTVVPTDKLSTYYVSVFAHDKSLNNNVLRQEMTVSQPVKLSVVEPQFLYEDDEYRVRAVVSNASEVDFEGVVKMELYEGDYRSGRPLREDSAPLTVRTADAAVAEFEVEVPAGVAELGLKLSFVGSAGVGSGSSVESVSDAFFVTVPVQKPVQTLTEAHSVLLTDRADVEKVKTELAELFTGTTAKGAEYQEISLRDMIMEAIPEKVHSEGKDVISMSDAFYVGRLAGALKSYVSAQMPSESMGLLSRILDCQNSDGGFGWYEDFNSSQIVTALVLERFAGLRDRGLLTSEMDETLAGPIAKAVSYLDTKRFAEECPRWCGGLSLNQYLHVRTRYPELKFAPVASSSGKKAELAEFKEKIKEYLLPKKARGMEGDILGKARRIDILFALASSEGSDLASAWGLKSSSKLRKSAAADMESLKEYAVEHSSGGIYYPNAVLPFRGLLESEAYAHSLLCDLNERWYREGNGVEYHRIAEGIRLWLMVQKESQQWDSDPGFIDAISSVLDGSDEILGSKVAVMTRHYSALFDEVAPAGNGFTVERKFYVERAGVRTEIGEGEAVNVGDKIVAEYRVWSEENRSFVRLETPLYAALRPVRQTSGRVGGLFRRMPLGAGSKFYFTPEAYMEVKADRTLWSFDAFPEENTVLTEEFYVTQAGIFAAPAVTVESLYAPHYRANDSAPARLVAE